MQAFHIRYRNTQGTLMRILNAASRRGLDLTSVQSEPEETDYQVALLLDVNQKQVGQLFREWYAIADVKDVQMSAGLHGSMLQSNWASPHPPSTAGGNGSSARAALA